MLQTKLLMLHDRVLLWLLSPGGKCPVCRLSQSLALCLLLLQPAPVAPLSTLQQVLRYMEGSQELSRGLSLASHLHALSTGPLQRCCLPPLHLT